MTRILLVLCALLALAGLAWGAGVPDPTADPAGFLALVVGALQAREWVVLAALMVVGLVAAVRKWGPSQWAWLRQDRGGAALALVWGVVVAVAASLIGGAAPSGRMLLDGALLGATAAGGWTLVKKILFPSDARKPAPSPSPGAP